jgi:kinesin family protein 5
LLYLDKLQTELRDEGGIKALLGMVRCRHPDVHAQVARGIANFAKCESRASSQGKLVWTASQVPYFDCDQN